MHLKTKLRVPQLAKALQGDGLAGIHLSPAVDKEALKKYCMKKDLTYVDGPWDDREEDLPVDVIDEKSLWPWQQTVLAALRAKPDDRKVCWLVDKKGCTGKTAFVKFCRKHRLALPLSYTDAKDAAYMVTTQEYSPAYVFDLTRCKPASLSATDLYAVMENIKNGLLQNTKYQSKAGILRPPAHVWVFANHVPDYKSLSRDRWMVYELDEQRNLITFDTKKHQFESKKRKLVEMVEAARAAKQRKLDEELVARLVDQDADGDDAAIEAHLGGAPAPDPEGQVGGGAPARSV